MSEEYQDLRIDLPLLNLYIDAGEMAFANGEWRWVSRGSGTLLAKTPANRIIIDNTVTNLEDRAWVALLKGDIKFLHTLQG